MVFRERYRLPPVFVVTATWRVSWACRQIVTFATCRSVCRRGPSMWLRAAAVITGSFAYPRATSSCRAGKGWKFRQNSAGRSRFRPISGGRLGRLAGQVPDRIVFEAGKKNRARSWNEVAQATLIVRRRAKPPSPSPSISRRRTPATLVAGVLSFVTTPWCTSGAPRNQPTSHAFGVRKWVAWQYMSEVWPGAISLWGIRPRPFLWAEAAELQVSNSASSDDSGSG